MIVLLNCHAFEFYSFAFDMKKVNPSVFTWILFRHSVVFKPERNAKGQLHQLL